MPRMSSHCCAKLATSGHGTRIGQHALHLLLEHARVAELAAFGKAEQLVVGHAAPEEERQPRREPILVDGVDGARRRVVQAAP